MKRFAAMAMCLFSLTWIATTTVWAQGGSPHFIYANGSLDTSGDYVASFKEAGLGNTPITYTLTATTENFTFQCFTKSGNKPQGSPNGVSFSSQSTSTTITPHNGQVTGSLTLTPEQDGASCQGAGLQLYLIAVDYEGVTLCDTTNEVCTSVPSLSASNLHIRF